MKNCSKCGESKPLSDFYKQKSAKDGYYSQCKACANASQRASTTKHREKVLARKRGCQNAYAEKHRETLRLAQQEFYKMMREERPELHREWVKKAQAAWRQRNPAKVTEQTTRRKAAKLRAVPKWANPIKIQGFYDVAKLLGAGWHVDHIVPLKSKVVCGLHCEANLRVIPATDNLTKGNKYWPDMP